MGKYLALGPYAMTSSQIFSHPARPDLVKKYILLTKLGRAEWKIFGSRSWRTELAALGPVRHDLEPNISPSGPACANAYGPHTGLSLMVLQRKGWERRTGHMINIYIVA